MDNTPRRIRLYADGANLDEIKALAADPQITGFTTNPSLMRKAGISDYERFAKDVLEIVGEGSRPVSFELFADDFDEMERQARIISSWGSNVYVKVPVMNTEGMFTGSVINTLSDDGIKLNVTAVFTLNQIIGISRNFNYQTPMIISVFAGRVADSGRDPYIHMAACRELVNSVCPEADLLWASPRQVYDIQLAERAGADIITLTRDMLDKRQNFGKDLERFSLETVQMFYRDSAGLKL